MRTTVTFVIEIDINRVTLPWMRIGWSFGQNCAVPTYRLVIVRCTKLRGNTLAQIEGDTRNIANTKWIYCK